MIGVLQTTLWFLVALAILVTFHEFGHFYVARRCGVKVLRFSVGFGRPLWSWWDKKGTEFAIAAIPLGGYVKMVDEREGEVPPEDLPYAFTRKTVWQRMAIVAAGPIANFILAIGLFWLLLIPGKADLIPVIDQVEEGSIAAAAGLESGQEIVAVDGQATPTQRDVVRQLINRLGETGTISFTAKYSDSSYTYSSDARLQRWLSGAEEPDPLAGIGIVFREPPIVVGQVMDNGPAAAAGFTEGDRVVAVDGQRVSGWREWSDYVQERPGQTIDITVERDGREVTLPTTPEQVADEEGNPVGRIQVGGMYDQSYIRRYEYSIPGAFVEAVRETGDTSLFILTSVKKLIMGEISPKNLSGPITIAKVAGSSASSGWMSFVSFLALLSVSLAVFNLLPIPVLDGGHLLYFIIEAVKGSPVSEKTQLIGYQVGLFMVVSIMLLAIYYDVLRL